MPTSLTVDWTDIPDAAEYEFFRGADCEVGTRHATTMSQYTITGMGWNLTHHIKVRGRKFCGSWSPWSACRSFTTVASPNHQIAFVWPPDGDPCQDPAAVTVTWDPEPGADTYQVRLGTACGTGASLTPVPGPTSHLFTGLNAGTTYFYQARYRTACGDWSIWSDCRSFTTPPASLAQVRSVEPLPGTTCLTSGVTLSWGAVQAATGYEVQWGDACGTGTL